MIQRTLCLIKPDAVKRGLQGQILTMIQESGLGIIGMKMLRLSRQEAEKFYAVHKERPFFNSLAAYMSSGPIVAVALQGEEAVASYRKLMGSTNPAEAEAGTIRKKFAESLEANSVHGSDSVENSATELAFFFSAMELVG